MPVLGLAEIRDALPRGARLMGLDLGSKTIGVALSDAGFTIASPLETLKRRKFTADAAALKKLIDSHGVGGLVLGLPINMDGSEGPRCQSTRQFAANLLEKFDIPIAFQDERLSTAAVERVLIGEADMTRKRRGEVVDKMAAAWILQGALDAMANR
jgi:putative Holliday junction resolvase